MKDDMRLPQGKTCDDCVHIALCTCLFECPKENTRCDWSPSRFVTAPVCQWSDMGEGEGHFETDCGGAFTFIEDGPKENGFRFCVFCGRRLGLDEEKSGGER